MKSKEKKLESISLENKISSKEQQEDKSRALEVEEIQEQGQVGVGEAGFPAAR